MGLYYSVRGWLIINKDVNNSKNIVESNSKGYE